MFEVFENAFSHTPPREVSSRKGADNVPSEVLDVISKFGGHSFAKGLYRVISAENYNAWMERISQAFPRLPGITACFGYDWQGDVFAVNSKIQADGKPGVVLFEIGSADVLELPFNLENFHNVGLVEDTDGLLTADGYNKWLSRGGVQPSYDECIGYKVPLFLGGKDNYNNLELSDIDVYWHILGQIMQQKIWSKRR